MRVIVGRAIPHLIVGVAISGSAPADEPSRPAIPTFQLPRPTPPASLDLRSDSADDRIGTYADPQVHAPWVGPAIGIDARVTHDTGVAFGAEGIAVVPFQVWRGGFDPGFFPTLRASWRGSGTLDGAVGFGFGMFEEDTGYKEGWKTISYTPQLAWRLMGPDAVTRGFRHDLVFKPGLFHVGFAHCVWPGEGHAVHELRLVIGTSVIEGAL